MSTKLIAEANNQKMAEPDSNRNDLPDLNAPDKVENETNETQNHSSKNSKSKPPENQFPFGQLEKLLTCPVCLDRYRHPKLLPCQHTYCLECLENMADYYKRIVKCPECRTENILPYKGVETFPNNLTIMSFLELPAVIATEEAKINPNLAFLQPRLPAGAITGNQLLADVSSSETFTTARDSSNSPITQPAQYRFVKLESCPICNENTELVKCLHCDRKICPECKESHMEQLQREIVRLLTNTQRNVPKLEETINIIEQKLANMKNNFNFVKNEIKMEIERCIRELNNRERVLLDEVDNLMESEIRKMTERQGTLSTEKEEIENYCQQIEMRLNINNASGKTALKDKETTTGGSTALTGASVNTSSTDSSDNENDGTPSSLRPRKSLRGRMEAKKSLAEQQQQATDALTDQPSPSANDGNTTTAADTEATPEQPQVTDEELIALKTQISTYLDHIRDINIEAVESYKRMKFIADNNMLRSNILTFGELHVRSVVHSGSSSNKTINPPSSSSFLGGSSSARRGTSSFPRSYSFENEDNFDEDAAGTSARTTTSYKSSALNSSRPYYSSTSSTRTPLHTSTSSSRFLSSSRPKTSAYSDYSSPSGAGTTNSTRRPNSTLPGSNSTHQDDIFSGYLANEAASSGHKNWRSDLLKKYADYIEEKYADVLTGARARNLRSEAGAPNNRTGADGGVGGSTPGVGVDNISNSTAPSNPLPPSSGSPENNPAHSNSTSVEGVE